MKARLPLVAALAVLALHGLVALAVDLPGAFRKYTLAAELRLAGELPAERLVDLSPLYLELAVAATRATPDADAALVALQVGLVALAAGLFAALLLPRFGPRWTALAVAAFAVDRHVLVYERILEPEAAFLAAILAFLVLVEGAVAGARWAALLAGLAAAASLGLRPTFLPVFLLVPFYLRWRGAPRWRRQALVFAAPVVAALALLALRSAAICGDPRAPVMNPGTVFYEGNNPLSRGTSAVYPPLVLEALGRDESRPDVAHEVYRRVARAATGEALSVAEVNAYWSGRALDHLRAAPGRALSLLRQKLLHAFHGHRFHDVPTAWRYDRVLPVPGLPFALVAALALAGLVGEARRPAALPFYVLLAAPLVVMLVFYVSARQRLVLVPAALYFATAAAAELGRAWRGGERRRTILVALLVLVAAAALTVPDAAIRDDLTFHHGQAVAQARLDALRTAAASAPLAAHADLALDALAAAPWIEWTPAYFPQEGETLDERLAARLESAPGDASPFDRATVLLRAGRLDAAEALFAALDADGVAVYRGARGPSWPRFYLGRIAALRGRGERAVELLDETLDQAPDDPFVLAELVALTGDPGRRARLEAVVSELDARWLVGRALAVHGRAALAAAELGELVRRLPEMRRARIELAAALGAAGCVDEGAAEYLEAMRQASDPLYLSAPVVALFRAWAARHPGEAQVELVAARVLHEHGRFHEALALLEGIAAPPHAIAAAVAAETRSVRASIAALPPPATSVRE